MENHAERAQQQGRLMDGIGRDEVVLWLRRQADRCPPGDRMWFFHAAHLLNRDQDTTFDCRVPGCVTCPPIQERHGDQAI
jgi:hypothetical protein